MSGPGGLGMAVADSGRPPAERGGGMLYPTIPTPPPGRTSLWPGPAASRSPRPVTRHRARPGTMAGNERGEGAVHAGTAEDRGGVGSSAPIRLEVGDLLKGQAAPLRI